MTDVWTPGGAWTDEGWYSGPEGGVWSARYTHYAHSQRREPKEQRTHEGDSIAQFMLWMQLAWAEWARQSGRKLRDQRTSQDVRLFDTWLPGHAREVTALAKLKGWVR